MDKLIIGCIIILALIDFGLLRNTDNKNNTIVFLETDSVSTLTYLRVKEIQSDSLTVTIQFENGVYCMLPKKDITLKEYKYAKKE